MASDGCDCSRGLANWFAATRKTNGRFCVLQFEQRVVGDLGGLCRSLCINRLAGLSFPHEPSGAQEKFKGEGKAAISGLTVTIEILFKTSGIHPQKNAFKEDQRIGVGVKPPDYPKRITENKSPKSDHPPIGSLRANKPGSRYRYHHGWPLHPIDVLQIHHSSSCVRSTRDAGTHLWIKRRQSQ